MAEAAHQKHTDMETTQNSPTKPGACKPFGASNVRHIFMSKSKRHLAYPDTPVTNKNECCFRSFFALDEDAYWVNSVTVRKLERELNEARAERDAWKNILTNPKARMDIKTSTKIRGGRNVLLPSGKDDPR